MKVKNGFFRKLKIAFIWIFKFSDGIGVHCNYCNGIELDFIEKKQSENSYISKYKCKRCGATATNIEMWKRGDE